MANTLLSDGNFINISAIDSDWKWSDALASSKDFMKLQYVLFLPGQASEKLVLKNGSDGGPVFLQWTASSDADQQFFEFHGMPCQPVLDYSAGTYANSNTMVILGFR